MSVSSAQAVSFAGALAAILLLGGCATDAGSAPEATGQPGATQGEDGSSAVPSAQQPASVNDVDLHFLAMMTPHHEQAVTMSDVVLAAEGVSSETRDLAERIKAGQQDEIDVMVGWTTAWNQGPLLAEHSVHIANGMVTPERMQALGALTGAEMERTFLTEMKSHHEGAIAMTQDQIDNGGFDELRALAEQMITVQSSEVVEMNTLLGS